MSEAVANEVRVLRGVPTAEELAALIAVLCTRSATPAAPTGYEAWRAKRLAATRGPRP